MLLEKTSMARKGSNLSDEVDSLTQENNLLNEAYNKTVKEKEAAKQAAEKLAREKERAVKDMEDRQVLIGQLEQVSNWEERHIFHNAYDLSLLSDTTVRQELMQSLQCTSFFIQGWKLSPSRAPLHQRRALPRYRRTARSAPRED